METENIKDKPLLLLNEKDKITGLEIVNILESEAPFEKLGRPTQIYRMEFAMMKDHKSTKETAYYAILYMEAYDDCYNQHHISETIFVPFGCWRNPEDAIGTGNAGSKVAWEAYPWSSQIHKKYPTYEELCTAVPALDQRRDMMRMVACGKGDQFQEYAGLPPSHIQDRKSASVGFGDPVSHSIRQQEYQNAT